MSEQPPQLKKQFRPPGHENNGQKQMNKKDSSLKTLVTGSADAGPLAGEQIRRWVYDPKAGHPVWVIRKFHKIGDRNVLASVNCGEAFPGDTICMDNTGRYWVENVSSQFEPTGNLFYDINSKRFMKLVTDGPWKDWIVFKHPDGQWVSLRKATSYDQKALHSQTAE